MLKWLGPTTSALTFETMETFFLKSTFVRVPHILVKQIQGKGTFVQVCVKKTFCSLPEGAVGFVSPFFCRQPHSI